MKVSIIIAFILSTILSFSISCEPSTTNNNDNNDNNNNDTTNVENKLKIIAESTRLWTGVAVSDEKRIFVNYPRWSTNFTVSVAEVLDTGQKVPFPNEEWNNWNIGDSHFEKFVCVQSVYYYDGFLWILDSGNPLLSGVLEGAPKIVKVDLANNEVSEIITVDNNVLDNDSYLNDLRIYNDHLIITDSGSSGLIIINLNNRQTTRRLEEHQSTSADIEFELYVEGRLVNLQVHSDGIAIDHENGYVYYQALSNSNLYRIKAEILIDEAKSHPEISAAVIHVGEFGAADGLEFTDGKLYITAIEHNAIKVYDPQNNECSTLVKANNLKWPDSISITEGKLYVTTSQLHLPQSERNYYRIYCYELE